MSMLLQNAKFYDHGQLHFWLEWSKMNLILVLSVKAIASYRFWKQQVAVAKEANQVDILCYRISLSYRLLKGTSKYKELHKFVEDAIGMLETEIGPVNGVSARIVRGNVSRLSVATDVQKLCSLAIMKAEQSLNIVNGSIAEHRGGLNLVHLDF